MSILTLCLGAFLLGWMLPELIRIISLHADQTEIPIGMNFVVAVALSLIAYGVKA